MNWIPAAKSSSIARWAGEARRRSSSYGRLGSRRCRIWRAGLRLGRREWIRRCRSTEGLLASEAMAVLGSAQALPFPLASFCNRFGLNIAFGKRIMATPRFFPQHFGDSCGRRVASESLSVFMAYVAVFVLRVNSADSCTFGDAATSAASSPRAGYTDGLYVKERIRDGRRNPR